MKIGQCRKRVANRNGRPLRSAIIGLETSSIWLLWLLVVLMCLTGPSAIHGQPTVITQSSLSELGTKPYITIGHGSVNGHLGHCRLSGSIG
jgi:hypothetical protein